MDKKEIARIYQAVVQAAALASPEVHEAYEALAEECNDLYWTLVAAVKVIGVDLDEPYKTADDMFEAIRKGSLMGSNRNLAHPIWTDKENYVFRVVHALLGHFGPKADFSWDGEQRAYAAQATWHGPVATRALYTEVIGQTAVRSVTGKFPAQKAFLYAHTLGTGILRAADIEENDCGG